ncbi:hypothetical protein ACFLY8_01625, partial [Halobacteriota archaeon]
CVGSRDVKNNPYCSSVCCMHATKEAILAKEHYPNINNYIFYTDMRAFGKGFQEYVDRAKNEYEVIYIRSRPGEITEDKETKNPVIWYDDTVVRELKKLEVGLVVLCTALTPSSGVEELASVLGVKLDENRFFKIADPLYAPLDSSREGILVCGYCQSPKDIPEAVTQAKGAAARAAEIVKCLEA